MAAAGLTTVHHYTGELVLLVWMRGGHFPGIFFAEFESIGRVWCLLKHDWTTNHACLDDITMLSSHGNSK